MTLTLPLPHERVTWFPRRWTSPIKVCRAAEQHCDVAMQNTAWMRKSEAQGLPGPSPHSRVCPEASELCSAHCPPPGATRGGGQEGAKAARFPQWEGEAPVTTTRRRLLARRASAGLTLLSSKHLQNIRGNCEMFRGD